MATEKKGADAGQAEAQSTYEKAAERGYFGTVPNPDAGKQHSLQTGPDSPTALDQHIAINEQRVADQKASPGENT